MMVRSKSPVEKRVLVPAALEQWAAEHTDQLSAETLDEVRAIAAAIADSPLRDQPIDGIDGDVAEQLADVFPTSRAERASTLMQVVASWAAKQSPSPAAATPAASITAEPHPAEGTPVERTPVEAEPVEAELVVAEHPGPAFEPAPVASPAAAASPAFPVADKAADRVVSEPIGAPAFLRSDKVDEEDDVRLYGPKRPWKAIFGTFVALSLVAGLGILGWYWFTQRTDAVETTTPAAEATAEPATDAADTVEPTPEVTAEPTAVPEPTPALPRYWADTIPILNSGTAEISASTYAVSPANRAVLTGHTAAITGIAVSDDGRVLTSGADRRLVDWGADVTLANPDVLNVPSPLTVLTRTEDQRIVAGDSVGNVTIIDLVNTVEPVVLPIHRVAVSAITELADRRLAVASVDGDVDVFAIDDPDDRVSLPHGTEVTAVVGLADGTIATAAVDGTIRLWPADADDATEPGEISTLEAPVTALTLLSDGQLAAASVDGDIHTFDPVDGASPNTVLPGHVGAVRSLFELSDLDGSMALASGGDDTTVRLWNVADATIVRVLEGHGDIISGIASLPDGRLVSTSGDGTGRVWDLTVPADEPVIAPHDWNLSALHPWKNDQFVTGGVDGKVVLASTAITAEPVVITQHDAPIVGVSVLDQGIAENPDDVELAAERAEAAAEAAAAAAAEAAAQAEAAAAEGDAEDDANSTTDADEAVAPDEPVIEGRILDGIDDIAPSDIVSVDSASVLRVSEAGGQGTLRLERQIAAGATALAVRNDLGVVTGHADGTVRFHDLREETVMVSAHGSGVNDVAALSNGLVASAGQDMTVRIIDPEDPDTVPVFDLHTGPVDVVIELPDGRIASAGADGIFVYTLEGLAQDHIRLNGQRSRTISLQALPGDRLISTGEDGRVRLWDLTMADVEPETLIDIPGVVNPYLTQAGNGLFVAGAARGYVVFNLS